MSNAYKFRAWVTINSTLKCIKFSLGECPIDYDIIDEPPVFEQFTGVKDKNGKGICEGDIVKYQPNENTVKTGTIIFERGSFVFNAIRTIKGFVSLHAFTENKNNRLKALTVIGNIHENPELLKS